MRIHILIVMMKSSLTLGIHLVMFHILLVLGSSFLCKLDITPIRNEEGAVVLFLISHKEIVRKDEPMEGLYD